MALIIVLLLTMLHKIIYLSIAPFRLHSQIGVAPDPSPRDAVSGKLIAVTMCLT